MAIWVEPPWRRLSDVAARSRLRRLSDVAARPRLRRLSGIEA
jgi:hypothetical protein